MTFWRLSGAKSILTSVRFDGLTNTVFPRYFHAPSGISSFSTASRTVWKSKRSSQS